MEQAPAYGRSGISRTRPAENRDDRGKDAPDQSLKIRDLAPGLLPAAPEDGIAGHAERQIGGILSLMPIDAICGV